MNFDVNLSHLNEMQKEAVMTTEGALLLLAGAGSGKTGVLISRIAHLLITGKARPHEIIAITFTNKAAGEMKERLRQMSVPGAEDVWASTFHSACVRILRRDIDNLGYSRDFNIYDTADTASLMKRILKELEIDEKDIGHKTVLNYISRAKDAMTSAELFYRNAEKLSDPRRKKIGEAYIEYEKRLRASNALDFDDLILQTVKLFIKCPDVLQRYQNRFKYIHVDEYQDTNNLQYHLTAALAGGYGNICVVGDDDQSIYKFRGATIENILNFEKHFTDARIIRMEQNYRSTGTILRAANDVIANNHGRKGKKLWTENDDGDKPVLYVVNDERHEAQLVADEIIKSVREGRGWQEHVILYRMNAQSNQFETAFKRSGIPYRVYGGTGFFERAEIKDMLAYLCVVHNPNDDTRLLRIINNPARGLGDTTVARLSSVAVDLGISVYEAIKEAPRYEGLISAALKLNKFKQMIEELRELNSENPNDLDTLYDELIDKTGYIKMLEAKKSEENLSRIENVRELKTSIISFMSDSGGTLFDFLSEMALYTDLDRDDKTTDKVMMMTMHSAKGLEFDTVFIAGAEDGIFPSARTIGDESEIEEERRLCYVAMTRAMRRLCFICASQRMLFGRTSNNQPSRFISEINTGNIDVNDLSHRYEPADFGFDYYEPSPPFSKPAYQASGYRREAKKTNFTASSPQAKQTVTYSNAPKPPAVAFCAGDIVTHTAFGQGVIKSITPAGNDALMVIDFGSGESKRLMQNTAAQYLSKK